MKFTAEDIQAGQILLVDKPLDWTSFNAVNKIKWKLKREFKLKKVKVGHAGTLDPRATGLLVICTGKATKKIPQIQDAAKEYWAEIKIGVQTESYDTEKPEILPQDISGITEANIQDALKKFLGEIDQKPPIFSALKVDGKRAYDLARAGQEVDIKIRKTTIHYIDRVEINLPYVSFYVGCSKGTYIRSLAHDIGQELGVGAYLTQLRRTKIGEYTIENSTADYLENEYRFGDTEE
ncbi:tRNA pseudouridine(55) synthase TruB [Elizabethkingia anophelis]|uniref:tRNA pseudouridine(55) synthase TruB n=1 Tax=Elizabethkingia anophelis TaxID=1117645 RepID=UPI0004004362|nr:tRNA pseudouridine(55) synthase TruB [Elizabethkingia anophelis]MCT3743600.1 tRNA pseudouridine(55) synthase TruB [Elizabethkingia anophelis]MCT4328334.1 tRNA pseudouridine(55) synthase TruB [Elizabethkingia anophelis]MDV3490353.1 tRNA pseudouridine(55) synthase TruB [Elizabethkingia anophelis]MDV4128635.1 tRNA pseudouridine(55) synthase TruB [Elizabethkingia anophelis]MDV4134695.1 tRNA pseudouridine(55) synthase TruB [Elizabethkingia anophelis]